MSNPDTAVPPGVSECNEYEMEESTGTIADSLDVLEHLDRYNRWVYDSVKTHLCGRVLEIGCGTGNITRFIADDVDEVVGIDPVQAFIDRFRQRLKNRANVSATRRTVAELQEPDEPAAYFDAAVSCNVFEHIDDDAAAMAQARRQLRPGAALTILVPAGPIAYGRIDRELGHYRRYTLRSLRRAMEAAGFEWVEGFYINRLGLWGWWWNSVVLRRREVPLRAAAAFNRIVPLARWIDRCVPAPFGQSVVGVGRRPRDDAPAPAERRP